jgi:hypothetical protein
MDAAAKSNSRLLLKLQQRLQASNGAAAAALPLQIMPGLLCKQQLAAAALAEAFRNPRWAQWHKTDMHRHLDSDTLHL